MTESRPVLHANIHKLVASQALSKLGDNFTEVALALFILSITHHNVADLGIVLAMAYAPSLILGWTVAGVIDRFNKRQTLLLSDLMRAVLVASIPFVHNFIWTLIAVFTMYSFAMVYRPMVRAIQPQIAGDPATNARSGARQQTYYAVADMGSYLAAAGVLFLWGVGPAFWVDAATYLGAALFLLSINVPDEIWAAINRGGTRFWRQLADGYRYLKAEPRVGQLTLLSAGTAAGVASLNTFTAPLSKVLWHVSSQHYVWLLMAMAVGTFISGWLVERYGLMERWTPRPLIAAGFVLTGGGYVLTLVTGNWWLGGLCLLLVGIGNGFFGVAMVVWIQQSTPVSVRARVLSIRGIGMGLGGALGASLGGWVGQTRGIPFAILLSGLLWLVLAIWCASARALGRDGERGNAA